MNHFCGTIISRDISESGAIKNKMKIANFSLGGSILLLLAEKSSNERSSNHGLMHDVKCIFFLVANSGSKVDFFYGIVFL